MVKILIPEIAADTEGKILNAAKNVFLRKGMDGARMQEIADEAGINKALLHYYFRSKEKLFLAIFADAYKNFFPEIRETLTLEISISEKIKIVVDKYIDLLIENTYLPGFILAESNRNPQTIISVFLDKWFNLDELIVQIQKEMDEGLIRKMNPHHFLVNLVSMCIFPFVAQPFITALLYNNDQKLFDVFIRERKNEVYSFVINALQTKRS